MKESRCNLKISADKLLSYYSGKARNVIAKCDDGTTIQFPVEVLRPFISRDGICGRFVIRYDKDNKFAGIEKISD